MVLNLIVEHIIDAYLCSPVSSFYIYNFLSFAPILSIFYFCILVLVLLRIVLYAPGSFWWFVGVRC